MDDPQQELNAGQYRSAPQIVIPSQIGVGVGASISAAPPNDSDDSEVVGTPPPSSDPINNPPPQNENVDPLIIEALKSTDRTYLLTLSDTFEALITACSLGRSQTRLEVTPATFHQRLLLYRCSGYYKLEAESDVVDRRVFVLVTEDSRIPERRIRDLVPVLQGDSEEAETGPAVNQAAIKVMRRADSEWVYARHSGENSRAYSVVGSLVGEEDGQGGNPSDGEHSISSGSGSVGSGASRSTDDLVNRMNVEKREAAYNEARSRIFMDFEEKENLNEKEMDVDGDLNSSSSSLGLDVKNGDDDLESPSSSASSHQQGPSKPRVGAIKTSAAHRTHDRAVLSRASTDQSPVKATTCWIAAEHALQHARSKMSYVSAVFESWGYSKADYAVYAGFDVSLIQSGIGYLEQIQVIVQPAAQSLSASAAGAAAADSSLLTDLGRLFSPFSSVLVTEFFSYHLPVFKDDGSVWEFDELVYCTAAKFSDGGASAKMPLVGICFYQSSLGPGDGPSAGSSQGGSGSGSGPGGGEEEKRRLEKGKERARGDEDNTYRKDDDKDPDRDEDPEDPSGNRDGTVDGPGRISFEIGSRIYLPQEDQNMFQTITMHGSLTIKTTPLSLAERPARRYSERHVQFEGLVFHATQPTNMAYKQFHVVVVIDSQQENARILSIKPKTTTDGDRDEKRSITTKRGRVRGAGAALSLGFGGANDYETHVAHASVSGTAMNINEEIVGLERKQYHSAITAHRADGIVRWGFNVDDANLQTWGMDMEDADVLPRASFEFVGDSNVPAPPPKSVVAIVVSHWAIFLPLKNGSRGMKRTWISKLLGRFGVSGGSISSGAGTGPGTGAGDSEPMVSYSNLFQIVALNINTDKLHEPAHYKAKLEVRSGSSGTPDVKRPAGESVDVIPAVVDGWRILASLGPLHMAQNLNLARDDDVKNR